MWKIPLLAVGAGLTSAYTPAPSVDAICGPGYTSEADVRYDGTNIGLCGSYMYGDQLGARIACHDDNTCVGYSVVDGASAIFDPLLSTLGYEAYCLKSALGTATTVTEWHFCHKDWTWNSPMPTWEPTLEPTPYPTGTPAPAWCFSVGGGPFIKPLWENVIGDWFRVSDRGEFLFYADNTFTVQARHGAPFFNNTIDWASGNQAVAWGGGDDTCYWKFELYPFGGLMGDPLLYIEWYDDPNWVYTFYDTLTDVKDAINQANSTCPEYTSSATDDLIQFEFADGAVFEINEFLYPDFGMNLYLHVPTHPNRTAVHGMCAGEPYPEYVNCSDSLFGMYPDYTEPDYPTSLTLGYCEHLDEGVVDDNEYCPWRLNAQAYKDCKLCSEKIPAHLCVEDVCSYGREYHIADATSVHTHLYDKTTEGRHNILGACMLGMDQDVWPEDPKNCINVGDPHHMDFHGGVWTWLEHGEYVQFRDLPNLEIHVREGPDMFRKQMANPARFVSVNHAFAWYGEWTCGILYEYHPNTTFLHRLDGPTLVVTDIWAGEQIGEGTEYWGVDRIEEAVNSANDACDKHWIEWYHERFSWTFFDGSYMSFNEHIDPWWGMNFYFHLETQNDTAVPTEGLCEGMDFIQLNCSESFFTIYPPASALAAWTDKLRVDEDDGGLLNVTDCDKFPFGPPPVPPPTECPNELMQEASEICDDCPWLVNPQMCVDDVCLANHIAAAAAILQACNNTVPEPTTCVVEEPEPVVGVLQLDSSFQVDQCLCQEFCADYLYYEFVDPLCTCWE